MQTLLKTFQVAIGCLVVLYPLIVTSQSKPTKDSSPFPNAPRNDEIVYPDFKDDKNSYSILENVRHVRTSAFVKAQQTATSTYFKKLKDDQEKMDERFRDLWNYPRYSAPEKAGCKYFTWKNDGVDGYSILHKHDKLLGTQREFLDPNKFSDKEDESVSLGYYAFNWAGDKLAYTKSKKGSDWQELHVRNVDNGKDLDDELRDIKWPNIQWSKDGQGFFYIGYEKGACQRPAYEFSYENKVFYHSLGDPQDHDTLVAEWPHSKDLLSIKVSDCGEYLIVSGSTNFKGNKVHIVPIDGNFSEWSESPRIIPLFTDEQYTFSYVTNHGTTFLFRTNMGRENYRLMTVGLNIPGSGKRSRNYAHTEKNGHGGVISLKSTFHHPNDDEKYLNWAMPIGKGKLIVAYIKKGVHSLELMDMREGKFIQNFRLIGRISNIFGDGGNVAPVWGPPEKHTEILVKVENIGKLPRIHRCQVEDTPGCYVQTEKEDDKSEEEVDGKFKLDLKKLFRMTREDYKYTNSKGVEEEYPMYILEKRKPPNVETYGKSGSKKTKKRPAILYAFDEVNTPNVLDFAMSHYAFVDGFDGIIALASITNGREYGPLWNPARTVYPTNELTEKLIAAATELKTKEKVEASLLAVYGDLRQGSIVAEALNKHPCEFGAAIMESGAYDYLSNFTNEFVHCAQYGCAKDEGQYKRILKASPIHHIRSKDAETNCPPDEGKPVFFPPVLIMASENDDRVPPSQSYKYIAELQYQHTEALKVPTSKTTLLRLKGTAGPGQELPVEKEIKKFVDMYSFLAKEMGIKFNDNVEEEEEKGGEPVAESVERPQVSESNEK